MSLHKLQLHLIASSKMKLEKEIVQKRFNNEHQKLVVNILFTSNWLNRLHNQIMKPHGITTQQYNILRILRGQHPQPATIRLLTERMLDKMSNASRLVEKLRQKGLLERDTCPGDRRQVNVVINEKGLAFLKGVDSSMQSIEQELQHRIGSEDAKEVNRILDLLRG